MTSSDAGRPERLEPPGGERSGEQGGERGLEPPGEKRGDADQGRAAADKGALTKRLTLRARLALLTAAAVAVAVAGCAAASWYLARDQLYRQLDRSLSAPMPPPPGDDHGRRGQYGG